MLPLEHFFRPSLRLLGAIAAVLVLLPSLASATIVNATASSFLGEAMTATLTVDDESQVGDLVITLSLDAGPQTGDLRAFYAHVADESLLSSDASATGADVTDSLFAANSVSVLGLGTQVPDLLPGCGFPGCDFGVQFGTFGIADDDIQSVTFVLSHATASLTVDWLADLNFIVKVENVGAPDGDRSGFSKLSGVVVVPEPSTAIMMLLGLTGLTFAGRAPRTRSAC